MAPVMQNSISKFKSNLKICCKRSMRKKNYNNFRQLRGKDKCYGSTSRWRCIQDTNVRNTIEKGTEEEKKTFREISNMKGKRKKRKIVGIFRQSHIIEEIQVVKERSESMTSTQWTTRNKFRVSIFFVFNYFLCRSNMARRADRNWIRKDADTRGYQISSKKASTKWLPWRHTQPWHHKTFVLPSLQWPVEQPSVMQ